MKRFAGVGVRAGAHTGRGRKITGRGPAAGGGKPDWESPLVTSGLTSPAGATSLPDIRVPRPVARLLEGTPSTPSSARCGYERAKRVMDVVGASVLLLLLAPLMLVVTVAIKVTSRGPVLFCHKRIGLGGVPFTCRKFRTMAVDAEQRLQSDARLHQAFLASYKIKNDPRVTPLGRLLRRFSIDELPQLLNVLGGSMSLIGPRPLIGPELAAYGANVAKLCTVKPGLGGLWQVCGRSNTSLSERVALDLLYVDHCSLSLDLRLVGMTAVAVLHGIGAC
ncbi:MAG TPA: sugar transferase [Chthonomonadales bacterium]|nr:sugar transferase [Chthonomonadales bacterium]